MSIVMNSCVGILAGVGHGAFAAGLIAIGTCGHSGRIGCWRDSMVRGHFVALRLPQVKSSSLGYRSMWRYSRHVLSAYTVPEAQIPACRRRIPCLFPSILLRPFAFLRLTDAMVARLGGRRSATKGGLSTNTSDLQPPAAFTCNACMPFPLRRRWRANEIIWRLELCGVHVSERSCRAGKRVGKRD